MAFVYKSDPVRGAVWARLFAEKAPDLPFRIWPDIGDPAEVRYLAAWVPPDDIMATFPNLELLFSVGAGVDQFDFAALPPELPVVRMIESGIIDGMVEYATMAVLALHRDLITYVVQQRDANWSSIRHQPAAKRRVGVLGLGVLGEALSRKLVDFGFSVAGWSRTRRHLEGVTSFAGAAEMTDFLGRCDILVCLLPLTPETRGILNADLFAKLPRGARLVNVGRGAHLNQEDLLAALESGQLSAVMLDVTTPQPLPSDHPLWRDPRVLITPYVASMTQPETAVEVVLDNLRRYRSGEPLVGLVDRARGY